MADNRAALKAALKALALAAVGVDDDYDTWAEDMSNAIGDYATALKGTGKDTGGDDHDLNIG